MSKTNFIFNYGVWRNRNDAHNYYGPRIYSREWIFLYVIGCWVHFLLQRLYLRKSIFYSPRASEFNRVQFVFHAQPFELSSNRHFVTLLMET
jgi:hypothetical protein